MLLSLLCCVFFRVFLGRFYLSFPVNITDLHHNERGSGLGLTIFFPPSPIPSRFST